MTDKQIIIDGVDVSGCRYYDDRDGYCDACKDDIDGDSFTKCMYEDDCYYKQLKRKEQECEELKEEKAYTDMACEQFEQQLDQLKEQLEAYKMEAEEGKEINAEIKAENEKLKNFHINLVGVKECEIRELARYKQVIEKVRELIKNDYCFETESCEFCANIGNCLNKQILQICDEVNDAQDNL